MKTIKQFDIWQVNLDPRNGSEQSWVRPCVIIETNWTRNKWNTTMVIPFTTNIENIFSYDVKLSPSKTNWIKFDSKLKFRQIRVIDKKRLIKKIWVISDAPTKQQVFDSMRIIFDFEQMFW